MDFPISSTAASCQLSFQCKRVSQKYQNSIINHEMQSSHHVINSPEWDCKKLGNNAVVLTRVLNDLAKNEMQNVVTNEISIFAERLIMQY